MTPFISPLRGRKAVRAVRSLYAPSWDWTAALILKESLRMKVLVLALAGFFVASAADAATRNYSIPTDEGHRIGVCLSDGASCGKAAADAFCKKEGFAESILFSREAVPAARVIDSGKMCEDGACQAFTRIKCFQPKEEAAAG
jgi:hypothetical protein